MARFNDDNSLEDILGCIACAQGWPDWPEDYPPIDRQLEVIIARIEDRLARNTNPVRQNWFSTALEFARQARELYNIGDNEGGCRSLSRTEEYLTQGNKAHRRKTNFVVGPDGVTHQAPEPSKREPERS